jgi:lysozyme family protein
MTRDEAAALIVGKVIEREGGIADVGDGKGITRFGQTTAWLEQFGFKPPINIVEAENNYLTWLVRTRLIGICDRADSLADLVIDAAVHAGHPWAIKALQHALGLTIDGIWGPETQAAVDGCDRPRIARHVIADRVREDGRLIERDPGRYARYAHGWANRRAAQIESLDG